MGKEAVQSVVAKLKSVASFLVLASSLAACMNQASVDAIVGAPKVSSTGPSTPIRPALISGTGSLIYGLNSIGSTTSLPLTIINTGTDIATLSTIAISASTGASSAFSFSSDNCSNQILVMGQSCTVTVTFAPVTASSFSGFINVNYTGSGSSFSLPVGYTANSSLEQPVLTLSPSPHNFNNVATNAFANQVISVSNNTSVSAFMGTASVSGSGYTLVGSTCNGIVLGASANCAITVRFTPPGLGASAGLITVPFSSAQGNSYSATDTLGGTGITPVVGFAFNGFTGSPASDSSGLTSTGVTMQWTAQTAAAYYKVTRTGGSTGTVISSQLFPTSVATLNVTGLTPNTAYQFKVNAYDVDNTSDGNTNWVTITTPNVVGSTFNGWSDVVSLGNTSTDIGTVDTLLGNTGSNRIERNLGAIAGFGTSDINLTNGNITVIANSLTTGQKVKFATDGTAPAGLTNGSNYYVINVNSTSFALAASAADAVAGTKIVPGNAGSGNMTVSPTAVIRIGWDLFTLAPSGTATSYNIYRSLTPTTGFALIGSSTSKSFNDYEVSELTNYYYKVQPVVGATEVVAATANDTEIKIYVPATNMVFVHRWITNREACTNLLGFAWPAGVNRNDNYSCAYTWGGGFAPNVSLANKAKWDLGYNLVVDRWASGCKFKTKGSSAPTGGSAGDVYLLTGTGTDYSQLPTCYYKHPTLGWKEEKDTSLTAAQRALMYSNAPGYSSTRTRQAFEAGMCGQRSVAGVIDGNGNSSLRLPRLHEFTLLRAQGGTNVERRTVPVLANVFSNTNLPAYGSCNNPVNNNQYALNVDQASYPNVSSYAGGYYTLMNGSYLTRNCYSRYEASELWSNEWMSTQYFESSGNNGYFIPSTLDAADNLLENFMLNGTMGPLVNYGEISGNLFRNSGIMLPLFGVYSPSVSATYGSRSINPTLYDYGPTPTNSNAETYSGSIFAIFSGASEPSGKYNYTSRHVFAATEADGPGITFVGRPISIGGRCAGQYPTNP